MDPPTAFLPPLKQILSCSNDQLLGVLARLHQIFIPEVRGSSIRRKGNQDSVKLADLPKSHHAQAIDIETIRTDSFERSFSIQWLTRFISTYTREINLEQDNTITERAAAILAICAGEAASGALTRTFTFQTKGLGTTETPSSVSHSDISVLIRDAPFESFDTASVGAKTWGGSCILSQLIAETPEAFGISSRLLASSSSFRILELGAGTGLTSILLGKLLRQLKSSDLELSVGHSIDISIVATDFHLSVLSNLCFNLCENFPEQRGTIEPGFQVDHLPSREVAGAATHFPVVRACQLDWAEVHEAKFDPPTKKKHWIYDLDFNIILGADIVYENLHTVWIKSSIEYFLRKPSCNIRDYYDLSTADLPSTGVPFFHLIIPLRSTHVKESQSVEAVFPLVKDVLVNRQSGRIPPNNIQWDLAIFSLEDITCDDYADEGKEDVVYRYYRIGWM